VSADRCRCRFESSAFACSRDTLVRYRSSAVRQGKSAQSATVERGIACQMMTVESEARTVICTVQGSAQLRRHPLVMLQQPTQPLPTNDLTVTGRRQPRQRHVPQPLVRPLLEIRATRENNAGYLASRGARLS
jgi:hypothetical protein